MDSIDDEPLGTYRVAPNITAPMPFTVAEAIGPKRAEYVRWLRSEIIREHPEWAKEHGVKAPKPDTTPARKSHSRGC